MLNKPLSRDATIDAPTPVVAVRSLRIIAPGRGDDIQVRVSAPLAGTGLPVILFSHGFGSSMDAYSPLVDYWAAHGFVVVQPTYLDAKRLALPENDPRRPAIWRTRVEDAIRVIDHLEALEHQVPGLAGRVDRTLLAAAGHSFGGQTTSMLLGARMAALGPGEDMADPRIKAGLLLASGGTGGDDLSDLGRQLTPYLDTDFTHMVTPALVVAGDRDDSPLTVRGPAWFRDPYRLSPGTKALLTLPGGEHMLGGISGYEVTETTDEDPERVAIIQRVSTAFLKYQLLGDEKLWTETCAGLNDDAGRRGLIAYKPS